MTPVPLTLPLRPSEANELAGVIFDVAERKPLTDEVRNRINARLSPIKLESIRPHLGSLARDPIHHSSYYVVVGVNQGPPQLLHMASASAPTSSIFHKALLIGRMRRPNGPELVINAVPFGPADTDTVEKFATRLDTAFLPRLSSRPAITSVAATPEEIAASFHAFRAILKRTGNNVAAIEVPVEQFEAVLWAAILAGWRDGYQGSITISGEPDRDRVRRATQVARFRVEEGTPEPPPDIDTIARSIGTVACRIPAHQLSQLL